MGYIYKAGSEPKTPKISPELEELGNLLEDYEISITRIDETLKSRGRKYQKLESLSRGLEKSFNSIKNTPFYVNAQNRLDIKTVLKDINYERGLKRDYLYKIEHSGLDCFTLFPICMIGGTIAGATLQLYGILKDQIQVFSVPVLSFFVSCGTLRAIRSLNRYRFHRKYENKLIRNSKELVKNSKPFINSLKKRALKLTR